MNPIKWCAVIALAQVAFLISSFPALALSDPGILPDVPRTKVPAGYGNYCSVTDPSNGGWALWAVTSGDSCAELSVKVGPNSIVQHAGLWSINGNNNNVMVRCSDGTLYYGRTKGGAAINWIFHRVRKSNPNCLFIISPTRLAVFGMPFEAATITRTSVFGYHLPQLGFSDPRDAAEFSSPPGSDACEVDPRSG